jgi:tetratricopeptide (TPR) repeat protein
MSNENIATDIGRAWGYHREGKFDAAIGEFERILKMDANNIDANYGMGLAQRRAGKNENAVKYFQKAAQLVDAAILARNHIPGERNMPDDDRYMMLARMLQQRLSELET